MNDKPQLTHMLTRLPTRYRRMVTSCMLTGRSRISNGDMNCRSIYVAYDHAFGWAYAQQGDDYHRALANRYRRIESGEYIQEQQPLCQTNPI